MSAISRAKPAVQRLIGARGADLVGSLYWSSRRLRRRVLKPLVRRSEALRHALHTRVATSKTLERVAAVAVERSSSGEAWQVQALVRWSAGLGIVSVVESVVGAGMASGNAAPVLQTLEATLQGLRRSRRSRIYRAALRALGSTDEATEFGESAIDVTDDASIRDLARLLHRLGRSMDANRWLRQTDAYPLFAKRVSDEVACLDRGGIALSRPATAKRPVEHQGRILYVASQSMPHHGSGYAVRTQALITALQAQGWDMSVATRFGYPNDRYDFADADLVDEYLEIDGISHRYRPAREAARQLPISDYQEQAVASLMAICEEVRPALLHAASNHQNGLIAIEAARRLGLPCVYEVRGLWHYTRVARDPWFKDSDLYRLNHLLEVQCADAADAVLPITRQVAEVLAVGGVGRAKMTIAPNCVDIDSFEPLPLPSLATDQPVTFGFMGSFAHYEGLDLLMQAAAVLRDRYGAGVRFLLVGDGSEFEEVHRLRQELGLEDIVDLPGRVPHHEVVDYYARMDVLVYPRMAADVCEVVSPLKPLEAMAMARPVVMSDVAALADMIGDRETGLLHRKGDVADLVDKLGLIVDDSALRSTLGANGRAWVSAERDWSMLAEMVASVYEQLGLASTAPSER